MATLELKNVNKFFGKVLAVNNLSFSVKDGEFVTLLGPSGCGKSTTLNLIAGLEDADSGDIVLDGEKINFVPPNQRDMAMVFQDYALYPHMTVLENLVFSLKLKGVPKQKQREVGLQVAGKLDIDQLLERFPRELSGGQRQRVAVGRAIVREPKVFLLDEPLSNLDERLRVRMRAELRELFLGLGATSLYVTHDQEEAMSMSDKIAILHGGVLEQFGKPDEIYATPSNVFVATFIGSPPINLFSGTLTADGEGYALRSSQLTIPLPACLSQQLGSRSFSSGAELIVGIRPEHLKIDGAEHGSTLPAEVKLLEPLGYSVVVSLLMANGQVIKTFVTMGEHSLSRGDLVGVSILPEKMLIFDGKTEKLLMPQVG